VWGIGKREEEIHHGKGGTTERAELEGKQQLVLGFGALRGAYAFVFKGDHSLGICLVLQKAKLALREVAREKRQAFTDEDRHNSEVKFVDEIVLQKGAGEFASAHVPDIFPFVLAERGDEGFWGMVDKGDAVAFAGWERAREDIDGHAIVREFSTRYAETNFVRLAAHEGGVHSFEEGTHGVVLGHKQEVEGAVRTGNVAVKGDAEAENDAAHGRDFNPKEEVFATKETENR
jgi:hypothetical protein